MLKIAFHTLGCKVNQYDTEAIRELFEGAGYESVDFDAPADIYYLNTCTVTGTGDQKSLKTIRRINREHPSADIIVAGCLAQREPEKVKLAGVRLIIGVQRRSEAVELYERAVAENTIIDATLSLKDAEFESLCVTRHEGKTRAVMKIQEGCDRYCSYCIIPYVRGPVRSMPIDALREEAERLKNAGYSEIVLTGIHLASYGRNEDSSLLDAIKAVCSTGVPRIRLGSLEPCIAAPEFASSIAEMPSVCRQFHLSMQSGSAGVLKRMHRRYTPDEYMRAVETLRNAMPDCALTTDVIAGFPGETEEEFEETCEFINRVKFARIHVFPYSRRSGTVADRLPNQISESVKKERAAKLIEIGNKCEAEYVQQMTGTYQTVLFETELPNGEAEGYTSQYVRVRAKAKTGEMKRVYIYAADESLALGRSETTDGGE